MKSILCRIAQLQAETSVAQSGWCAKHLASCQECRTSIEKVKSLEARLRSETPPYDEANCDAIIAKIKHRALVVDRRPAHGIFPHFAMKPWLLGTTGLAVALAAILAVMTFTKPAREVQIGTPAVVVVVPSQAVMPSALAENNSIAHMMHQQALLQRDAWKLGAHLRQHVILFQPGS